ncbi:Hypothetical protein CINCED_3A004258 [Cinara cedri]|uniref:Uncharacterized protein n=1 Tax=Cinara cedri TaxID=506608 RepID=A0A5E4NKC9_9HEMI|nr:Hypothetical protein CINCED_3A004258 [Cinara cedri]
MLDDLKLISITTANHLWTANLRGYLMYEIRLSGLCMLILRRKKVDELNLAEKIVDAFGKNKRILEFLVD